MYMAKTHQGRKKLTQIASSNPKAKPTTPVQPQTMHKGHSGPKWNDLKAFMDSMGLGEYLELLGSNGIDEIEVLRGKHINKLRQNKQSCRKSG